MSHSIHSSTNTQQEKLVVILMGPPGSGKGTQAIRLSKAVNIPHISTGDLFRENLKNSTPLGLKVKNYMDAGKLVPDTLVLDMLFDRVKKDDCQDGFLLDGFPRTLAQAQALDAFLNAGAKIVVFNIVIPDEEVIRRAEARLVCKTCGKMYNTISSPPKVPGICDVCGGELYQRSDDTAPVIKERLNQYYTLTKPVEVFYKEKNLLIEIDGKPSPDVVFKELQAKLPLHSGT